MAAVTGSGFFVGRASSVAKIHRVALYGFLNDCCRCRGRARALRATDFGNRSMHPCRDGRLLIVTAAVLEFLKVSSKVKVLTACRRVVK
jgi:hypothetical protein